MPTLRPITDADLPFLLQLYATTREAELAGVPWTAEEKAAFVLHQFTAQHRHWQENYIDTRWDLIEEDAVPIGRLYVARRPEEIHIVDIALVPAHRGRGLGTTLLQVLFAEGDASGRRVSIYVEVFNPARALYERLGFAEVGRREVYVRMERPPAPGANR